MLKIDRYDASTGTLTFTAAEAESWRATTRRWADYFTAERSGPGLGGAYVRDTTEGVNSGVLANPLQDRVWRYP